MNKKKLIVAIIVILCLVILIWQLTPQNPEVIQVNHDNNLFVRTIPSLKPGQDNSNLPKVFQPSLYEGTAAFIGPYRLEITVQLLKDGLVWMAFIDNSQGMALTPKNTEIILLINKEKLNLVDVKNGLMANNSKQFISLPQNIQVLGKINGQNFATTFNIKNYRRSDNFSR